MSKQGNIYIGTSGWSYPSGEGTWKGYFYPSGKINELEYYSRFFNTVEINSSFTGLPIRVMFITGQNVFRMVFLLLSSCGRSLHIRKCLPNQPVGKLPFPASDVDIFKRSIEPLSQSGKLGALLAQFPPAFKNDEYGKQILNAIINTFSEYRLAVELRHRSWSDDSNISQMLKNNNAAWVNIDEPKFESSVASDIPVTSDMAYFRFHGRNRENWWTGNNETRYKYLYSDNEVEELTNRVSAAATGTKLLFAFFNNHWQGYAPRNAVSMINKLQLPFRVIPVQNRLPYDNA